MIPIETKVYSYISCVLQSSIYLDDIGVSRDTVFQETRSGVGFETDDLVKVNERWGGYRRTTRPRIFWRNSKKKKTRAATD